MVWWVRAVSTGRRVPVRWGVAPGWAGPWAPPSVSTTPVWAKKAGGKKPGLSKAAKLEQAQIEHILEEAMSDDDDDDTAEETMVHILDQHSSPVAHFMAKHQKGSHTRPDSGKGRMKAKSSHTPHITYGEIQAVFDIDRAWNDMVDQVALLQRVYVQSFTLRSVSALDDIPIVLEGDEFPLKEVADISKKDPKRLILDCQSFPQAAVTIMEALRQSGLNLNPQQEGLRIFVPLPKVTREYREKLAQGAKKREKDFVDDLRKVFKNYNDILEELTLENKVNQDDHKAIHDVLLNMFHYFCQEGEQVLHVKLKEIQK